MNAGEVSLHAWICRFWRDEVESVSINSQKNSKNSLLLRKNPNLMK